MGEQPSRVSGRESVEYVFVGVYERQLDERGRVALPTAFRGTIGEQWYLTFGDDGCVRLMSADVFQRKAQQMLDDVKSGSVSRAKERVFASSVVVAGTDKQGRLLIDQRLREHAGIGQQVPVMVLGALDRVEIWEPSRYEQQESAGLREMNE
ncbi:MAG: MraZ protein [Candidatus Aldehydirespiratoraceae bacterium]|jgi:MraZ protein